MWYARDRSLLQLHLPEGWPSPAAIDANFRYARFEGGSFVTGVAPLAAVPSATTAIAVAPASAVLFVRVTLPKVRGNKLARLLPLAVEDAIPRKRGCGIALDPPEDLAYHHTMHCEVSCPAR
jgi:hypothetical protein